MKFSRPAHYKQPSRFIPTKAHGYFDYIGSVGLILAPNILSFVEIGGAPVSTMRAVGICLLISSMLTDYEVGLIKFLPMKAHLLQDRFLSLFLAASPWLFYFSQYPAYIWMPHVLAGLSIFAISMVTEQFPKTPSSMYTAT